MADNVTKISIKVDSQTATSNLVKLAQEFKKVSDGFTKPIGEIEAFAKLKKSLAENETALQEAQTRVRDLARELKNSAEPSKQLSSDFEKAKNQAKGFSDAITRQKEELHRLRQSMQASGVDTTKLASEQLRLKNALKEANAEFLKAKNLAGARDALGLKPHQELRAEITRLKDAYKTLAASGKLSMSELAQAKIQLKQKIGELKEATNGWRAQLDSARTAIAGLIAATAGIGLSVKAAMNLQTAMSDVAKVVDAPSEEIEILKNRFLELSRVMPFTAVELAKIAQAGGQMGIASKDISAFVEMTAKIGTAFNMTSEEAGTAVGKLMNIFHLTVPEVGKLADAINVLGNNTNAVERDITDVLTRVGGAAQIFGLTARETSALATAFLSLGKPPEVAATAINALLTKLQTANVGTKEFKDAMARLGISSRQLAKDISEHPQQALIRFLETLKQLDRQSQAEVLTKLFGQEYQDDLGILLTGLDQYKKALGFIANESQTTGAVNDEFGRGMQTLENQLKLAKNAIIELGIVLGGNLLDAVTLVVEAFTSFINVLSDLAKTFPVFSSLVTILASLAASFSALAILGRTSWLLFAKAIESVQWAVAGVVTAAKAMAGMNMASILTSLSGAATGAVAAISAMGMAMKVALVGGATLAAAALIGFMALLYKINDLEEQSAAATEEKAKIDEKASKKAAEIGEKLGMQIGSLRELNKLVKDGKIYWDDQTGAWKKATQVLNKQTGQMELSEEAYSKLKDTLKEVGSSYAALSERTSRYYDFAAQKAQALATNERQTALDTLDIYRQKAETLLQIAQDEAARKDEIVRQSGGSEQQQAEQSRQIAEDLKNARIKTLEDWQSKLQSSLLQAIAEEKKYAEEVKRLQESLAQAKMSTEERVRDLRRRTMTEEQAWVDKQKQAYETLRQAQQAIANAQTPDQLKAATELAKKAQEQFAGLAGEIKEGDQVVKTEAETTKVAIQGVEEAGNLVNQSIEKQITLAEQNRANWQTTAAEIGTGLDDVKSRIDTINNTPITPTGTIHVDSSEVDAKLAQLNSTVTHSTHVIHVQTVQESSVGGMIRKFAEGGWNRLSGKLPGWGGGDRIRALLEAGEFIVRKEAVAKYGANFFNLLNSMKIDVPGFAAAAVRSIPKIAYAEGGMVSGSDYGTLRLQAGDLELPALIQGRNGRQMVKEFEKELSKMRLTRGR